MHVADHAELLAILNTFASASVLGVRSGRFGVGAFGERERCSTAEVVHSEFRGWRLGGGPTADQRVQTTLHSHSR